MEGLGKGEMDGVGIGKREILVKGWGKLGLESRLGFIFDDAVIFFYSFIWGYVYFIYCG